jgi:uncharacterized surface protein with fasciclin (FAS1) repeats
MQNSLLIIIAAVAIVGGGYFLLMNTGGTVEPGVEDTATDMQETMVDTAPNDEVPAPALETDQPNIVEVAVAADDFTTLVTAVTAAELADVLAGPGPFTVFAPTDAAFAALPDGTLDTLLLPDSQADLANILTYHVVPGAVSASDLTDGMTAQTVSGETITFGVSEAGVTVNGANVVTADIEASNGIIHVVDTVLLPSVGESATAQ